MCVAGVVFLLLMVTTPELALIGLPVFIARLLMVPPVSTAPKYVAENVRRGFWSCTTENTFLWYTPDKLSCLHSS